MTESKLKHLELIQNVISRMNSNSSLLKGWSITLVSASFALAVKDSNINYVLISYVVLPVFLVLDVFFISTERAYRGFYPEASPNEESEIKFSMDDYGFSKGRNSCISGVFSKTLVPFYGISITATLTVMFLIKGY